jgi:hypothetical protein
MSGVAEPGLLMADTVHATDPESITSTADGSVPNLVPGMVTIDAVEANEIVRSVTVGAGTSVAIPVFAVALLPPGTVLVTMAEIDPLDKVASGVGRWQVMALLEAVTMLQGKFDAPCQRVTLSSETLPPKFEPENTIVSKLFGYSIPLLEISGAEKQNKQQK